MEQNKSQGRKKVTVAFTSVFAALLLTVTKLTVGLLTNSLGILAEALHSGLDMVAAIITLVAVYFSKNPADLDHNFGHGKIENFSALIETLILILTCGWIIFEAMERFIHPVTPEVNILSFAVIIFAIIIDYERSRMLFKVAKETRSQALEADALHFSTDILSSSVVLFGLFFVIIGFPLGDAIAALMVAIIVIWISVRLGLSTINALMDKVPREEYEIIKNFVQNEFPDYEIKRLRLRESGPLIIGDLTILFPSFLAVDDFHAVSDTMHKKLEMLIPHLDLMINAHPKDINPQIKQLNASTVQKVINSIKLPDAIEYQTHNVTLYKNQGTKIDLDLELPNELTLSEAYKLLEYFRTEIKAKIKEIDEVHIHLEPFQRTKKYFDNEIIRNTNELKIKIKKILESIPEILAISSIELSDHKGRLIIHLELGLDGNKRLEEAHEVTYIVEARIFQSVSDIDKIFIHLVPEK
jgi:cation diffusion facilitator family transporter